jgi:hypothetical protein
MSSLASETRIAHKPICLCLLSVQFVSRSRAQGNQLWLSLIQIKDSDVGQPGPESARSAPLLRLSTAAHALFQIFNPFQPTLRKETSRKTTKNEVTV